ncbi:acyl--CoA ligase [Roseomonas sp. SSH11]|uniref:Acyl--CoA ligase n=1 Tax=Pararoseomonas baculiformis TaxID=2820812 RepID=A0ABS4AH23_9PROT|nr:class I adenylate-forming enzyme family protein [Pararoseomonas baculiformis]MBP0445823.1 acyl--CoA ligase [Pararoseomonas baculiformis]
MNRDPLPASQPMIPPSAPAHPAAAAGPLYIDILLAKLEQGGDKPVLRHRGRDVSARALLHSVGRFAAALSRLGTGAGDLVALLAPNSADALALRYATHVLGAVSCYLPTPRSAEQGAALVAAMQPRMVVLFPETAHLLPRIGAASLMTVGLDLPGIPRLDAPAEGLACPLPATRARPEELAVITSSGGTTGVPKGSRRSFAAYTATVNTPSPADRRQLVNGPLAYLSQVLTDTTLLGGGVVVLEDCCEPAATLRAIETERVTDLFLVEPQLFALMDHPGLQRRDLSSLRAITHVGASAPPILRRRALERLGPVLVHVYGASEIGLVSVLAPAEYALAREDLLTSAGRIRPGVEVRFRRSDGTLASPGEIGLIEVRSPAMAEGYRNRPDLEAATFHEGWYSSADLGHLDQGGLLHVLGRAGDIAWIDGAMVTPTCLEEVLCRDGGVRLAVAVAEEDASCWFVAVLPWPGAPVSTARCAQAIAASFGAAVAGRVRLLPLTSVPLTEQGKPDREAIRAMGRDGAASPCPGLPGPIRHQGLPAERAAPAFRGGEPRTT